MRILTLILVYLLSCSLFAKKIEGSIIENGDTSNVTLYVQCALGYPSLTRNSEYFEYSEKGEDIKVLYPKPGVEVHFNHKGDSYIFQSLNYFSDPGKSGVGFMCLERKGKYLSAIIAVNIIEEEDIVDYKGQLLPNDISKEIRTTFYSPEKGFMKFGAFNFRKQAKLYFSDCPTLVSKIDEKEFTRSSILEIVDFYNRFKENN